MVVTMTEPQDIHEALETYDGDHLAKKKEDIVESDDLSIEQKKELAKFLRFKRCQNDITKQRRREAVGHVTKIFEFCFDNSVDPQEPTHKEIELASGKMNELKEKEEMADTTYQDYIKDWRNFHHNVTRELNEPLKRAVPTIPKKKPELFQKIKNPKRKNKVPSLSTQEMVKLIRKAPNRRDACIIALYLELGVRPSELHKVTVDQVDLKGRENGPQAEIEVSVIKNEELVDRTMLVTRTYPQLEAWMQKRESIDTNTDRLFVNIEDGKGSERGDPMTGNNINQRVKKTGKKLGYDLTRSKLRSISVDYWLGNSNLNIKEIKNKFGWKDIDRVRTYDNNVHTDLADARRRIDGLKEKKQDHFELKECQFCWAKNSPTYDECYGCGGDLSITQSQIEKQKKNMLGILMRKLEENTDLSMEKARQISENTLQNVTDNMKGSREGGNRA